MAETYNINGLSKAQMETIHNALKTYNNMYIGDSVAKDLQFCFHSILHPEMVQKYQLKSKEELPMVVIKK